MIVALILNVSPIASKNKQSTKGRVVHRTERVHKQKTARKATKKKNKRRKARRINPSQVPKGTVANYRATFYGNEYKGFHRTANGDVFNMHNMTCASNSHPFGTRLLVKNPKNGKSVIVTVTDRGGFPKGYIDLTYGAFKSIANLNAGNIKVEITVL